MAGAQDEDAAFRSAVLQVEQMAVGDVLAMCEAVKGQMGGLQLGLVAAAVFSKAKRCAHVASLGIRSGDTGAAREAAEATRVLMVEADALLAHAGDFEARHRLEGEVAEAKKEIEAMLRGEAPAIEEEARQMAREALARRSQAQQPQASGCGGVILFGLLLVVAAARVAMELVGA